MSEHLTDKQFENYKKKFLSASELARIDEHIQSCVNCRDQLALHGNMKRGFDSLRSDFRIDFEDHLTYEQLEGYVDGKLDEIEQENALSHLEVCARCSSEEKDLRGFRTVLLNSATPAPSKSGVLVFLNKPRYRTFAKIAGVAALLVIAVLPFLFRLNSVQMKANNLEKENQKLNSSLEDANSKLRDLHQQLSQVQRNPIENQITTILKDANIQIALHKDGKVTATRLLSPEEENLVKNTFTKKTVETPPFLAELISKKDILMGSSTKSPFSLIAPVGTAVQTNLPIFRWTKLEGATGYIARLFDKQFHQIAASPNLSSPEWTVQQSLKSGIYLWQVTAIKDGKEIVVPAPPLPEAQFKVLSSDETEKLEEAQKKYQGSHLMLGILYAQAGLLDDSEKEFEALTKLNPGSKLPSELLQSIRKLRNS